MADDVNVFDYTHAAYIDMQSGQFTFVKLAADKTVTMCDTSGEAMCGILQNNPKSGENAVVRHLGCSKLKGRATVAFGTLITTDHSGMGLSATMGSGDYVICMNSEALASGKTSEVIVRGTPVRAK